MYKPDSLPASKLLRNGVLLIIPPMIISIGLWGALPAVYSPDIFWKDIPKWLGLFENIFRVLVFSLPGILYFGKKETGQPLGCFLYIGGLAVYLSSYLAQIVYPDSTWSQSIIGFTALAWSTLFWFAGIGLVCKRSWLPIPWHRAIYLLIASIFLIFHIWHTVLVFFNIIH
ncbi:MAG: hypothetical protein Q7U53_15280 [Anaerolineaceae bacterium]|nr:hypothetical protein [Anaerolineaceae bacterium]